MPVRPGDDFDRDILDIIPERFDADEDSHEARAGHRLRTVITLVLAVVAVGGIVIAGWRLASNRQQTASGIPVIKADDRPIKIRPDDRGGMQVPNQDKLVYERMDGQPEARTERLLAPPEQPIPPPKPAPAAVPEAAVPAPAPIAAAPMPPAAAPHPAAAGAPAPAAAGYTPVESRAVPPAPPPPVAAVPEAPHAAVAPPARQAAPTPPPQVASLPHKAPPAGDYVVQLGAVRSAEAADKEWTRIQHANSEALAGLKSDIVRVDLGEKGTFWRIRAGTMSEQAARALCRDLSQRNQGCIVARK